jgi:phosphatidylglycerophosphate synthase
MDPQYHLTQDAALLPDEREAGRSRSAKPAYGAGDENEKQRSVSTEALVFATAPAADGGPAAALSILDSTVLGRLLDQLESLGVRRVWLVTRPDWTAIVEGAVGARSAEVRIVTGNDVRDDLRTTAEIASRISAPLIVGSAHVVTHREALAGLLADPRIASGALVTASPRRGFWLFPLRSSRGRVVSAASPYHRVEPSNGYFLGFIRVESRDREQLITASRRLVGLAGNPRPERWEQEFERKAIRWRLRLWRAAVERDTGIAPDPTEVDDPVSLPLEPDVEAELALRLGEARENAVALLLVGLVRAGVYLSPIATRRFFYATPLSTHTADTAVEELSGYDEDRVALDSAVKANDGFFTTFFVSPYSKYLARFAARRGWSPNLVTILSLVIGVAAAASFAVGNRLSLIVGAVLLQLSFTVDCVDGQLARYTRTFSNLGAWLDSVFDRMKEYLVYGGLAVGARGFGEDVWLLAAAALTLQTVRHMSGFAFQTAQREAITETLTMSLDEPNDAPGASYADAGRPANERLDRPAIKVARALRRSSWLQWGNRVARLPIGERFALISLTAAIASPRATFIALLAWGGTAAAFAAVARIMRLYAVPQRILQAVAK